MIFYVFESSLMLRLHLFDKNTVTFLLNIITNFSIWIFSTMSFIPMMQLRDPSHDPLEIILI